MGAGWVASCIVNTVTISKVNLNNYFLNLL